MRTQTRTMAVRALTGLALVAMVAGCGQGDPSSAVSPSHAPAAESAAAPDPTVRLKGVVAASETVPMRALTPQEAYDVLYRLISPSDALIDSWNSAVDAEDWAAVREVSGRLADALRTLQTEVLAQAWPEDATDPAQAFATALEDEIGWYSVVSIATNDAETWSALDASWSDAAASTSEDLWTALEEGLATAQG